MYSSMIEKSYPLFLPPVELARTPTKEWTKHEARTYFNWFVSCLDKRIVDFLQYIDESADQSVESLLVRAGDKVESILQASSFYRETGDGLRLSNMGYAVAADCGLLVAKLLIANSNGRATWKVLSSPRSAQSFNLPVLIGFKSKVALDPVAASIAQATGVVRRTDKQDRWLKLYEYWIDQLPSSNSNSVTQNFGDS